MFQIINSLCLLSAFIAHAAANQVSAPADCEYCEGKVFDTLVKCPEFVKPDFGSTGFHNDGNCCGGSSNIDVKDGIFESTRHHRQGGRETGSCFWSVVHTSGSIPYNFGPIDGCKDCGVVAIHKKDNTPLLKDFMPTEYHPVKNADKWSSSPLSGTFEVEKGDFIALCGYRNDGWETQVPTKYHAVMKTKQFGCFSSLPVCTKTEYIDNNVCKACPSGSTCDGTTATVCAKTKYIDNNVCKACPSAATCDGTTATCQLTGWKTIARTGGSPQVNVYMTSSKAELQVSGLRYEYEECVPPSDVHFRTYLVSGTNCGTTALPFTVSGTPGRSTVTVAMTIDGSKLNARTLGAAYTKTGAEVSVTMCVRASVEHNGAVILSTEDIVTFKYSGAVDFNVRAGINAVTRRRRFLRGSVRPR